MGFEKRELVRTQVIAQSLMQEVTLTFAQLYPHSPHQPDFFHFHSERITMREVLELFMVLVGPPAAAPGWSESPIDSLEKFSW